MPGTGRSKKSGKGSSSDRASTRANRNNSGRKRNPDPKAAAAAKRAKAAKTKKGRKNGIPEPEDDNEGEEDAVERLEHENMMLKAKLLDRNERLQKMEEEADTSARRKKAQGKDRYARRNVMKSYPNIRRMNPFDSKLKCYCAT